MKRVLLALLLTLLLVACANVMEPNMGKLPAPIPLPDFAGLGMEVRGPDAPPGVFVGSSKTGTPQEFMTFYKDNMPWLGWRAFVEPAIPTDELSPSSSPDEGSYSDMEAALNGGRGRGAWSRGNQYVYIIARPKDTGSSLTYNFCPQAGKTICPVVSSATPTPSGMVPMPEG